MKTRAILTSVGLSLLFVVVYSTTNWLASQRTDVGTWYYQWELSIPLVPLMIIPYMSIDLFFVAAPFLCRDRHELGIFAKRITFAILLAGSCFLLWPLKLGFERHEVDGWLGMVFNPFLQMDHPYNLLPSLHITLRTVLAELYARKTSGLANLLAHVWFSLIGLSTLLTHQHHVVDVVGGFALAGLTMYLFQAGSHRLPVTPNRRIGSYYGLAAIGTAVVCLATWRTGAALLWPTVALGAVTVGYFGRGPGIYRKHQGKLSAGTRFVLAPVLAGQQLSLLYYRRQCRAWDKVTPEVLIGRQLSDALAAEAIRDGVTAVLDLTAEFSEAQPFLAADYLNVPVLDLTAPTLDQIREMVAFIDRRSRRGKVYVHCKIGYSRSAVAVGAYLLASGRATTVAEAMDQLRAVRPSIVIRPEAEDALEAFASELAAADGEVKRDG